MVTAVADLRFNASFAQARRHIGIKIKAYRGCQDGLRGGSAPPEARVVFFAFPCQFPAKGPAGNLARENFPAGPLL